MNIASNGTTQPAMTVHTARRATLSDVTEGPVEKPSRIVIYGVEGIGKSTMAASAPSPIFLGSEDGTWRLSVKRVQPVDWENVLSLVADLETSQHGYRTLVLDTLDWAEPLCWAHVCRVGKKASIEDFGYGKGYVAALDEWRRLLAAFDRLRDVKGMAIILLAHSKIATFKNPTGDDFDRYSLKLHEKSAGLIKEWSDIVAFCNYETFAHTDERKRTRGVSTGARLMYTVRTAAYDAKNRHNLPEEMPLSWDELAAGIEAVSPRAVERGIASVRAMLGQLDDESRTKAEGALERAGTDATKVAMLADWCRGKLAIEGTKETGT